MSLIERLMRQNSVYRIPTLKIQRSDYHFSNLILIYIPKRKQIIPANIASSLLINCLGMRASYPSRSRLHSLLSSRHTAQNHTDWNKHCQKGNWGRFSSIPKNIPKVFMLQSVLLWTCALPLLPGRRGHCSRNLHRYTQQNDSVTSMTSWAVLWTDEKNVWK